MPAHPVSPERIRTVRELVELGLTSRQISRKLDCSIRTVDRYRSAMAGEPALQEKLAVKESSFWKGRSFPLSDEYEWKRCRECRAQVLDGWAHLHDEDCSSYADDRRMHPRPVE